ncbi:hypothetical protein GCM10027570_12780 [Streptomonospora sediminis]
MKSWRTLITAGLATGAAAVVLPLTASPASAADDWSVAGGGYPTVEACIEDGYRYMNYDGQEKYHDYTEFQCYQNGSTWAMRVR